MSRALGMIEFKSVAAGMTATDIMVKTSEVDIVEAQTVCPGKYIAIITGDLSAVKASVDTAMDMGGENGIDSFVLGNPDESIFPAILGTTNVTADDVNALGVIETFDAAQIIVAADNAVKTSDVRLIEIRLARGMCGKSYVTLTGEVAAVKAAVDRAKEVVSRSGMLLDTTVIARPDRKFINKIL
ncbi:MAG: BMC domain-containing protein [Clostridia bacterium]|nr:BMC domain-containing protein [Clostridia bacterium]